MDKIGERIYPFYEQPFSKLMDRELREEVRDQVRAFFITRGDMLISNTIDGIELEVEGDRD